MVDPAEGAVMATYEVTAPDGRVFEVDAPEGATQQQIIEYAQQNFANAAPQKPKSDPVVDAAGQLVRGVNRGLNAVAALPGALVGGAVSMAGFPETGKAMQFDNAASRFMTSPDVQPQTELGRYADATGQALGASALPSGALIGNASRLAAMTPTTALGGVAQDIGRRVAAAPGAAVAADVAASTGGAVGVQLAKESGYGPGTQAVAGLAGAFAPGMLAASASRVAQPLRRAMAEQGEAGAYGNIANSVDGGAEALARDLAMGQGEGRAAGQVRQRVFRILGEEMTAANGDAAQAQAATIARVARETGVTPQTAQQQLRGLQAMNADNPLMLGEVPSVARADDALRGPQGGLRRPENIDVEQLKRVEDSATRGKFDYLASSGNAPSAVQTRNALMQRQDTLADNFRGALARIQQTADSQGRSLNITDAENLIENAARESSRSYEAAYNAPIDNRVMLETLPRLLDRFERQSLGRAGDVGPVMEAATRLFQIQTPNGPVRLMTLRQLQDARTSLRETIDGYSNEGRQNLARPLRQLYSQVTALMRGMSPQWADANRQWADMSLDVMGRELGDAFAKNPGPRYRQQLAQFEGLNPQAQDIVRVHYIQKQLDILDNAKDSHAVAKFFTSDHNRQAIRTLFGNRSVVEFTRVIRNIEAAEKTFAMNSRTHIRGQVKGQEEAYTSLEGARRSWSIGAVRDLLLEKAGQVLTERRNRPMADIITTPVSDVPRTAMHVQRMRQQQNRLRQLAQPRVRQIPASGIYGGQQYEE